MFELKSNSIGLASTKNSKLQIAQAMIAMMQICIFFAVVSLYCYGKLTRVELLTECSCYSSLLFTTYLISYFIETLFIATKRVHPIIFLSNVFHNSHLIQKRIQNQQQLLILYTFLNQMRVVKNIRCKDDRMKSL